MRYLLNLFALFTLIWYAAECQEVTYHVTNYTTKDYGRDFHPTNMAVTQDQRGIIYSANGFKLLEYDGSRWRSYPINKEKWILSLASGGNGVIYAGSQNEFGYFAPDRRGELLYNSISDSLDINDLDFTNIWKVHSFSGGVIFQAEEKIFIYKEKKIKVIKPETSFHTSFIVGDSFYVRERGRGLMQLKNDELVKLRGSEIFDTTGVFLMLPYGRSGKEILTGTREKGFWIFNPSDEAVNFRRFNVNDASLLEKAIITGGTLTADGSIAISTMFKGVIEIDTSGRTKAVINTGNGLSDNDVKDVILDQGKNIWVALNNGISRIEISSPLSLFNEKSGISGSINSVLRFNDLLYAGTTTGLFVQGKDNRDEAAFRKVPGLNTPVRSLLDAGGTLIAGSDAGLFIIRDNKLISIDKTESFALLYSSQLRLILSGGPKGLRTYSNIGQVKEITSLRIEGEDIIGLSEEKNVSGSNPEFWLGTRYNGVLRITVNNDFSFKAQSYGKADGLPEGPVIPARFNEATAFETIQGLYSFTNEATVKESLPDSLKNNQDFVKGFFSVLNYNQENTGKPVSVIAESPDKIWICSNNSVGYLDRKDSLKYDGRPFRGIESGKINVIYPEETGISWIGTTEGLIRYDENSGKNYDLSFNALIREVSLIDNDSAVYLGAGVASDNIPALKYIYNSMRFDFSASFYEYQDKITYSYKLDGRSPRWSQWSGENYQEFTNLREGQYTFIVKARNVYGTESTLSRYSFTILPPWYRSVTSYIIYVISAGMLLWLFARLYSIRLKRENIRLEGIVNERTAEIVKQKDEIEQKNLVLEYQKKEIEDSIRYAQRIQTAVIPSEKVRRDIIPESFVFFRPLNIVSGDFYWISSIDKKIIFAAADCTGHGVPGAFMSMLGVAFLNEIVNKDKITSPDLILNNLRDKVIQALQQQGSYGETRDGMDIALVSINIEQGRLEYAGAYNPLIMIRNGEIMETQGDKMPVGFYENMRGFSKHEMKVEKGDLFYMYSDGYEDQFGGTEGKKFKSKRLKNLLLEISASPMEKQKEVLEKVFDEWKGDLPQVDDIVIVGISIK